MFIYIYIYIHELNIWNIVVVMTPLYHVLNDVWIVKFFCYLLLRAFLKQILGGRVILGHMTLQALTEVEDVLHNKKGSETSICRIYSVRTDQCPKTANQSKHTSETDLQIITDQMVRPLSKLHSSSHTF